MKKRIVSWSLDFLMLILALNYLPTTRHKVVFIVALSIAKVLDMCIGMQIFREALCVELDDRRP